MKKKIRVFISDRNVVDFNYASTKANTEDEWLYIDDLEGKRVAEFNLLNIQGFVVLE